MYGLLLKGCDMAETYLYFCDGSACTEANKDCYQTGGSCRHTSNASHSLFKQLENDNILKSNKIKTKFELLEDSGDTKIFVERIDIPNKLLKEISNELLNPEQSC